MNLYFIIPLKIAITLLQLFFSQSALICICYSFILTDNLEKVYLFQVPELMRYLLLLLRLKSYSFIRVVFITYRVLCNLALSLRRAVNIKYLIIRLAFVKKNLPNVANLERWVNSVSLLRRIYVLCRIYSMYQCIDLGINSHVVN